jgi:hypothetical protein
MTFVVVSSYENVKAGDLQEPGESVAVFPTEALARERYSGRWNILDGAARAKLLDSTAAKTEESSLVVWVALLKLPIPADDIDEALETIEIIIEEAENIEEELDALIVDYNGTVYASNGETPYPRKEAIDNLQAWLS